MGGESGRWVECRCLFCLYRGLLLGKGLLQRWLRRARGGVGGGAY